MTNGREQSAEVMNAAEEDAADDDPEQNRKPAESCRLDRAVDRACAGDGGEVVTHQDRSFRRNVVNAILKFVCGRLARRIDSPLLGEPAAVADVTDDEQRDRNDQD